MFDGVGDHLPDNLWPGGTPPVSRRELLFPVLVTDVISSGGVTNYSFREQVPLPSGLLTDAVPGRSGLANASSPAFELNQDLPGGVQTVLQPPFYAWCRPRGVWNGSLAYDLLAPLGTPAAYYNSTATYYGGGVVIGNQASITVLTGGTLVMDGGTVNVIDNTTYNIYPGASLTFVTVDDSGTVVSTALSIISGVGGALTYDFLLDGYPVSTLPPVSGQVLTFDGVEWTPVTPGGISAAIPQ